MSKSLHSFKDLKAYGINALTGEACGYSLRVLCDLNEDGVALIEEFFGSTLQVTENSNWNSQVEEKPAVGSVMLARSIFQDLALYCLWRENYAGALMMSDGSVIGVSGKEITLLKGPLRDTLRRNPSFGSKEQIINGRYQHQASLRVA